MKVIVQSFNLYPWRLSVFARQASFYRFLTLSRCAPPSYGKKRQILALMGLVTLLGGVFIRFEGRFSQAHAQVLSETGLPLPRFVSLRGPQTNLRAGPGKTYPISWVFLRKHLPVEIIAEFDVWRRIRDQDGAQGWVHRALLSAKRTVIIKEKIQPLYENPSAGAVILARLEAAVIADLSQCQKKWCEITIAGYQGWVPQQNLWGVYGDEVVSTP
jgi:SH3-like domain-containing protein